MPENLDKKTFNLYLTDRCNFNCTYCYQDRSNKDITTDLIDKLASLVCEGDEVWLFGGEPTLVVDLIEYAVLKFADKKVGLYLFTNGSILTSNIENLVRTHNVKVQVSFDSACEHLLYPTAGKTADDILKNISTYQRCSSRLQTNTVITPQTINGLHDTIVKIYEAGSRKAFWNISAEYAYTQADIESFEKEISKIADFIVSTYEANDPIATSLQSLMLIPAMYKNQILGCGAGVNFCAIDVLGNIFACHRCLHEEHLRRKTILGNINALENRIDLLSILDTPYTLIADTCGKCLGRPLCKQCYVVDKNKKRNNVPRNSLCSLTNIVTNYHLRITDSLINNELYMKQLIDTIKWQTNNIIVPDIKSTHDYLLIYQFLSNVQLLESFIKDHHAGTRQQQTFVLDNGNRLEFNYV